VTVKRGFSTVFQAFEAAVKRHATRPFLRVPAISSGTYADDAVEYSYAAAHLCVLRLISAYQERSLVPGDRVALAFDSRLETYLHLLALNALGISIVPLNSSATDSDISHIVSHSDCRLIVVLPEYLDRLKSIAADINDCQVIAEAELVPVDSDMDLVASDLMTEAALLYTSGTTGKPKGCMLSNEYFLGIGYWYNDLGGICNLDENDRLLTPLPPNHMNALCTSFPAMLLCGGCVIQVDRFHPRSWWQTVREEDATIIHCLGVMTAILLTLPEAVDDDFTDQIKFCFGPGSDPRHQLVFEKRFGFPLVEAWAMTESGSGGITIAHQDPRHVGQRCIGRPFDTTECRIVDEKSTDVVPGQTGELLVRSKGDNPRKRFFSGYYKDEVATEAGWDGGWWHTGDVVREGEDGCLFFVDRRKNVIRRSGENIAAVEVEATLLQHPNILACAVCAVPDEIRGDEVFSFIISDKELRAEDIFDHCLANLTYFKVPGYIAFVPTLPLTASQKVSRGEIKTLARARLNEGDCTDLRSRKRRTHS
jgi:acyl-coenzyme A synthetase/AMP-(fatty) acid ligase